MQCPPDKHFLAAFSSDRKRDVSPRGAEVLRTMKTPEFLKDLYRDQVDGLKKCLLKDLKTMRKKQLEGLSNEIGLDANAKADELRKLLLDFYEANWTPAQQEAKKDPTKEVPKQKKKWRVTDPAEIAPNYYHDDLFTANFPLVSVKKYYAGQAFPVTDKFEGPVLNLQQTKAARSLWSNRLMDVEFEYKAPSNETEAFPHHLAFVEGIVQFTKPGPDLIDRVEKLRKRKHASGNAEVYVKAVTTEDVDGESYNGLNIAAVEEDQLMGRGPGSKNEGAEILPGGSVDLIGVLQEHEDVPSGFADALLYVQDKRPLLRAAKRQKAEAMVAMPGPSSSTALAQEAICAAEAMPGPSSSTAPAQEANRAATFVQEITEECYKSGNMKTERVAAVLERKFAEDESKVDALFQGGYYASKHAMVNIQNGHGTPVYVLVMTSHKWSYGVLVPEGFVQIQDGEVDARSMDAFKGHQEITGITEHTLETLQKKLAAGTEFYQKNFRDNPQAKYRNGPMLVGTYYLRSEWFSLPTTEHGGFGTDGALRLFDGLMRLVLGDSVLKMTAEGLANRVEERVKLREELKSDVW